MTPTALVVFDLDGTLLRGFTVCELLADSLGRLPRMQELETTIRGLGFAAVDGVRAAREEMATWYQAVGVTALCGALDRARLAPGTEPGLAMLRAHGVALAISSITWSFAVEHIARRLGIEYCHGTVLEGSGAIAHVWPEDKATWVRALAERLGVPRDRTAAVGDSAGDCEMLLAAGVSVYVGRDLPAAHTAAWRHHPDADIEAVARDLVTAWKLPLPGGQHQCST